MHQFLEMQGKLASVICFSDSIEFFLACSVPKHKPYVFSFNPVKQKTHDANKALP